MTCSVAYVARRFAQSLQQQLKKDRARAPEDDKIMYEFDDKEVLCAEIAGLCHDLGIIIVLHARLTCHNYACICMHNKLYYIIIKSRTWSIFTHV